MNNFMKSATAYGNKMMGQMGVDGQGQARPQQAQETGMMEVLLSYENLNYRVALNVHATASSFATQIYVATNVVPQRQKIVGFNGPSGQLAPLKPDGDLAKLQAVPGMQLSMTQLPPGQEIDPSYLTPHQVDRVGAQCMLLEQRADAIEGLFLTQRLDAQAKLRLHQLCLWYGEAGLKLLLKMDEIDGDANVKAARKALVKKANAQLDRIDRLKANFLPQPEKPDRPPPAGKPAGGASDRADRAEGAPAVRLPEPEGEPEEPRERPRERR